MVKTWVFPTCCVYFPERGNCLLCLHDRACKLADAGAQLQTSSMGHFELEESFDITPVLRHTCVDITPVMRHTCVDRPCLIKSQQGVHALQPQQSALSELHLTHKNVHAWGTAIETSVCYL